MQWEGDAVDWGITWKPRRFDSNIFLIIYIYMYIYIYAQMCIYIYIYIEREIRMHLIV